MSTVVRESWKSRVGFVFAALGSAVGLGSIWRFPYIVGAHGGAAFILLYLICLFGIGFPALLAEILIGQKTQKGPADGFQELGGSRLWRFSGKISIVTGLVISSFYSVVAGWTVGYLVFSCSGQLSSFIEPADAKYFFTEFVENPFLNLFLHLVFMSLSAVVLVTGVRKGIERGSKIMMPLLFIVLVFLIIKGLTLPNAMDGVRFLFHPDWSLLTPSAFAMALGQAFFTLSLGQGTMVTYGSYLSQKEDVFKSCFPVVLLNTLLALMMGVAVFAVVFSAGLEPSSGPALIFETLPVVFSQISWGFPLSIFFFTLVVLAAITSQISALEPTIAYFCDRNNWSRKKATIATCSLSALIGVPSVLAFNSWSHIQLSGQNICDLISTFSVNILVPVGGLWAVLLVGWKWGIKKSFKTLTAQSETSHSKPLLYQYFKVGVKYSSPLFIILVLLDFLI